MSRCKDCGTQFAPTDSIGSDFRQCQDCWESESAKAFWAMVELLPCVQPVPISIDTVPFDADEVSG